MPYVKNLHLLDDIGEDEIKMIESAAEDHHKYNNVDFKILEHSEKQTVIRVTQGKSSNENYFDAKRLDQIAKETYGRFFKKLISRTFPYKPGPVETVTPDWLQQRMRDLSIQLKKMVEDTGLDKTQLSPLVGGSKPLSNMARAMFYYYFKSEEAEKSKKK